MKLILRDFWKSSIAHATIIECVLFYHKQWIQCISNVSKIGIFYSETISNFFTSDWYDLYFHCRIE